MIGSSGAAATSLFPARRGSSVAHAFAPLERREDGLFSPVAGHALVLMENVHRATPHRIDHMTGRADRATFVIERNGSAERIPRNAVRGQEFARQDSCACSPGTYRNT